MVPSVGHLAAIGASCGGSGLYDGVANGLAQAYRIVGETVGISLGTVYGHLGAVEEGIVGKDSAQVVGQGLPLVIVGLLAEDRWRHACRGGSGKHLG